ncbi:P-loop containing nucleoside triphosphate hydrolase protein [Lentinula raphanica]|nr:P-loop containing nucleoside triphosphate hydrolase protein [Lentinula raphanica]
MSRMNRITSRKFSLLMHLVLNNKPLMDRVELLDNKDEVYYETPLLSQRLRQFNVPPFWDPECPDEYQEKWGKDWKYIHEALVEGLQDGNAAGGRVGIERFKYEGPVLENVCALSKSEGWGNCMDDVVQEYLVASGWSIRERFELWAKKAPRNEKGEIAKGFVGVTPWSGRLDQILEDIFGDRVRGEDMLSPTEESKIWFTGLLQTYLDIANKDWKRALSTMTKTQVALEKILGEKFWTTLDLPEDFTLRKAKSAFKLLLQWKSQLTWQVLLASDEKIREQVIDVEKPDATELIAKRWEALSVDGRKADYCQMALGFVVGVIEAKTGKDVEVQLENNYDDQIVKYGRVLARAVRQDRINAIPTPSESDFNAFKLELTDFAEKFVGRDDNTLSVAISMYDNPDFNLAYESYLADGEDIGVGELGKYDPAKLYLYLGLPKNGVPVSFRSHTADEPSMLPKGDHEGEFRGSVPVSVSWHQLIFVARVIQHMTATHTAQINNIWKIGEPPENAFIPVKEQWAKFPGICLFDEVGLGKTMCAMATIATLQSLYHIQQEAKRTGNADSVPACLKGATTFGNLTTGIPNQRHLIVVPTSLVDQWCAEILRFFRQSAVHVHRVSSSEKKWAGEIKEILATKSIDPLNQIVIVAAPTLQRMFRQNSRSIAFDTLDGIPRLKYNQSPNTLYAIPWCSTFLDEVQDARTGKALWKAMSAIFDGSLLKVPMTATPLLESPNDLVNLALLVRPPTLDLRETSNLKDMSRDLRILKGKSTVRTHQEALELTSRSRIVAAMEGTGVAYFASTMVKIVQRHLAPLTVKRTNRSKDWNEKPLGAQLPPHTFLHVSVTVTDQEADMSYEAFTNTVKADLQARVFDTNTLGKFFNEARSNLSFPSGDSIPPEQYGITALESDSATKLKCAIELVLNVLRQGADAVFPEKYKGSSDGVVTTSELGLPDFVAGWHVSPLLDSERHTPREKIIMYTTYAKFHPYIEKIFNECGIKTVVINGSLPPRDRTKLIDEFRHNDVDLLVMSQVGSTGLNLTCARTLILYEAGWSAVTTQQIEGRIHRRGQKLPTYVVQLMAAKTVEVLLIANGLGKRALLDAFMEVERNESTLVFLIS